MFESGGSMQTRVPQKLKKRHNKADTNRVPIRLPPKNRLWARLRRVPKPGGGVPSKRYFGAPSRRSYEHPMEDRPNVLYALRMSRRTTASVNIDGEIARNYKRMHEAEVHRGMTN